MIGLNSQIYLINRIESGILYIKMLNITINILNFGLMILCPILLFWLNSRKHVGYYLEVESKENKRFSMPQKIWLLSLNGILTSLCLFVISCLSLCALVMQISQIHWSSLISIYFIYWFSLVLMLPAILFYEHKDDYITIEDDALKCKCGGKTVDVSLGDLQKIVKGWGDFTIYTVNKKKYRFPKNFIIKFFSSEILIEKLQLLCRKN